MKIQKKIFFCSHCGNVIYGPIYEKHICCNDTMNVSDIDPTKYFTTNKVENWKDLVREELVQKGLLTSKTVKKYNKLQEKEAKRQQIEEQRKQIEEKKNKEVEGKSTFLTYVPPSPSTPQVTCPYCHSTDTKKITQLSRVASIGFWGVFSKKLGKQWHCNKCGSDF